jgi:nucleotide-binding universal stress UspA family protein
MKRILLPTDFSENSINAIDYALSLFENQSCEFNFLNVQKPSEYISDDIYAASPDYSIYEAIANDNKKQLIALKERYVKKYESQPFYFEEHFDFDNFTDAIQQLVAAKNIQLIIMGTNGATNASEVLFGSNTLQVIRQVRCPILAIPMGFKYNGLSSILFTLREEDHFHPNALTPLGELVRDHDVSLEVLQLDTHNKLPPNKVLDQFSTVNYHRVEGVPTPEAISSYEQLLPIDMHAIFIRPKSFFERIFSGSNTSKITYQSRVPLLVLK